MFGLFKKKTREEHVIKRTENIFTELISEAEFEFTELETVQIVNNVRRKLSEYLKEMKTECMEQSVNQTQKAKEIDGALEYIE